MNAMSHRTDSMDSMCTEDDSEAGSGACYESHLERHSPTSLLPEHPFSIPMLKVGHACRRLRSVWSRQRATPDTEEERMCTHDTPYVGWSVIL